MKYLLTLFFSLATVITCFGQLEKATTFRATANFNITLNGLATNEAGAGLGLDASFFQNTGCRHCLKQVQTSSSGTNYLLWMQMAKPPKVLLFTASKPVHNFLLRRTLLLLLLTDYHGM